MHLIWEEYLNDDMIMMICCNQKEFFIYDERDPDPEKTKLLRRVTGGHEEEITIMAYRLSRVRIPGTRRRSQMKVLLN